MRNQNKARVASLTSSRTQLERLRPNVVQGASIIRNEAEARRREELTPRLARDVFAERRFVGKSTIERMH